MAQGIRTAVKELQTKRAAMQPSAATMTASSTGPLASSSTPWNVPFARHPFFTGREAILTDLVAIAALLDLPEQNARDQQFIGKGHESTSLVVHRRALLL